MPDTSNDDLEDISWENMFMKMTSVHNFDSVIDEEDWFVMGISLPFKIKSFDNTRIAAFTNSEDHYNDTGLYLELNKYIYKELLSLNINLGLSASNYKFEATNYTDKSLHLVPALGIEFPLWSKWMRVGIDIGYSLSNLKNENGEYLNRGLILGTTMVFDYSKL